MFLRMKNLWTILIVSISKESASELSDGEDEEQFLDYFEEGSNSSREGSTADKMEDDDICIPHLLK